MFRDLYHSEWLVGIGPNNCEAKAYRIARKTDIESIRFIPWTPVASWVTPPALTRAVNQTGTESKPLQTLSETYSYFRTVIGLTTSVITDNLSGRELYVLRTPLQ